MQRLINKILFKQLAAVLLILGCWYKPAAAAKEVTVSAYNQKIKLEEKIKSSRLAINLGVGQGLYLFKSPDLSGKIARGTLDLGLDLKVKLVSDNFVYQGISFTFSFFEKQIPASNITNWQTDIDGFMLQTLIDFSYRHYSIIQSRTAGWTYKHWVFGGGPALFFYFVPKESLYTLKFGVTVFMGLQFAFKNSPVTVGAVVKFSDIFAYPDRNGFKNYKFWVHPRYHQQIFNFSFKFSFNF